MDKKIALPLIPSLDTMSADDVMTSLEAEGVKLTVDSVCYPERYPYRPLTTISLANSGERLYADVFVRCNYLRAVNYENNSPVHEDSSIIFFIESPELGGVWMLCFNAIGTVSGHFYNSEGHITPLTDAQIDTISRCASCGRRPFEELEGLFTWNLLLEIPFSLLGIRPGETVRANIYKTAYATSQPHLLSWIPDPIIGTPLPSPATFGEITLGEWK